MTIDRVQPSLSATDVHLVSVNVAQPAILGTRQGEPVQSAIGKIPVTAATLWLDTLNLEGDRQADRRVHGGPDKAVYAYPVDHLAIWNAELGVDFGPATFGENLTIAGVTEDDVLIGDVWSWGDARLQVCQPRYPCYKLAMKTGRPDIIKRFVESARSGWYLRVLEPGRVPVTGPIQIVSRDPAAVTVRQAFRAILPDADRALMQSILRADALAPGWREAIAERLESTYRRDA